MASVLKYFPCPNCGNPVSSSLTPNYQLFLFCKKCGYDDRQKPDIKVNITPDLISIDTNGISVLKWSKEDWEKDSKLALTIAQTIQIAYERPQDIIYLLDFIKGKK